MSFNKRFFNIQNIKEKAKDSTFSSFNSWMLNPDACIFETDKCRNLWLSYINSKDKLQTYNKIKNEI